MALAWRYYQKDVPPFIAMITVECTNVGLNILLKAATLRRLSYYVFIAYSYAIATILLLPLTFIFLRTEVPPFKISGGHLFATLLLFPLPFIFRRTGLPPFNLTFLFELFLLGLTECLGKICLYRGIEYSSPTLASAISKLTPAFVFILAVIFRMERLSFRSSSSQAKVIGTLLSISGALVVVLFKGPTMLSTTAEKNWEKGGLLLSAEFLLYSPGYILQAHIMKTTNTNELVLAFLNNLCGTIISAPLCLLQVKESSAWIVTPDIPLLAILYSGAFGSSLNLLLHVWGVNMKGPVYVSSFKPLSIPIAAAFGVIFLGDELHLGGVVGAVMLSIGFFAVLRAKAEEEEMSEEYEFDGLRRLPSARGKTPLLESYKEEHK